MPANAAPSAQRYVNTMLPHEPIQRVRVYLNERDTSEDRPLYMLALERLQREGATGATALRGVAGFGPGHRLRTSGPMDLSQSVPIVIEWIDRAERIVRVLPRLDDLLPEALITIEDLRVYRAALRSIGPFGERSVGEVLTRDIAVAEQGTPLRDAVEHMLERKQPLIPVLDGHGRIAGIITAADLDRRAGLALPLRILGTLPAAERDALLAALRMHAPDEVMTTDPRIIYAEAAIPHAVGTLVEWGLDALPVTDQEGRFTGIFGVEQALRAALEARHPAGSAVRDAEPPTPVRLVMQTAVPTIAAAAPLAATLTRLLGTADRFLVVVDAGRPIGALTDAQILSQLDMPLRTAWLEALRAPDAPLPQAFEFVMADRTAGDVAGPVATIDLLATQDDATRLMLDQGHERLVVVDDQGRLAGLLARRGLLRALAQVGAG